MDSTIVGPSYVVEFPFIIKTGEQKAGNVAYVEGNKISFNRQLIKGETTSISGMSGFSNDAKDYIIKIENHKTGAGVKIIGDHPISRMIFWAMPKTLCPEPFINIKIEPGEEFTWKLIYEFYNIDSQK
jgi:hypothetical protein